MNKNIVVFLNEYIKYVMEQEQHGEKRAEYGKRIIEQASKVLTEEFGKGFSETTIRSYRQFYLAFPTSANSAGIAR